MPAGVRLITTSYVLLECSNDAARRLYRNEVVQLRADLGSAGDLFEPTTKEVDQAWSDYAHGLAGTAGVVDLISFAVMRRLGVVQAFTNDNHFTVAGFEVLFQRIP